MNVSDYKDALLKKLIGEQLKKVNELPLEQLADVKQVVVEAVPRDGFAVLNALHSGAWLTVGPARALETIGANGISESEPCLSSCMTSSRVTMRPTSMPLPALMIRSARRSRQFNLMRS